jgi:hypothetical protein
MYPVPRQVKVAFHIFGLICFIESLVHIGLTAQASDCVRLYNYFILYVFIHTVFKMNGFKLKFLTFLFLFKHATNLITGNY